MLASSFSVRILFQVVFSQFSNIFPPSISNPSVLPYILSYLLSFLLPIRFQPFFSSLLTICKIFFVFLLRIPLFFVASFLVFSTPFFTHVSNLITGSILAILNYLPSFFFNLSTFYCFYLPIPVLFLLYRVYQKKNGAHLLCQIISKLLQLIAQF